MKKTKTAAFATLGCRVNQYETRAVEESFVKLGFEIRPFSECCDVYVINTCTVTGESDRKSRQMIRRAVKNGKGLAVVAVMGCMSQTSAEAVKKIEGVSVVLGNGEKMSCAERVVAEMGKIGEEKTVANEIPDVFLYDEIEPMSVTGSDITRAFLKVVDGCENNCAYCIIPKARGRVRSKKPEEVARECENIVKIGGCREIVLTGIETAQYGRDIGTDLAYLVETVSKTENLARIRLGSLEPTVLKEDFVKRLAMTKKFMPHFHLSLQSGSDGVLARMKRKYNTKMFYEKLVLLKKYFPDCLVTTDIIVGFPGETEEEFRQTEEFVKKCGFLYVHIFPYSDRKGTAASLMEGKISENVKQERAKRLENVMKSVRGDVLTSKLGREFTMLCENKKDGYYHGYTENYIEVRVPDNGYSPNELVRVRLDKIENEAELVTSSATFAENI